MPGLASVGPNTATTPNSRTVKPTCAMEHMGLLLWHDTASTCFFCYESKADAWHALAAVGHANNLIRCRHEKLVRLYGLLTVLHLELQQLRSRKKHSWRTGSDAALMFIMPTSWHASSPRHPVDPY